MNGFNNLKMHMYLVGKVGILHVAQSQPGSTQAQALAAVALFATPIHG